MNEEEHEIFCREALWSTRGIGVVGFASLISFFGSGKAAWEAKAEVVSGVGLSKRAVAAFLKRKQTLDIRSRSAFFKKMNVSVRAMGVGSVVEDEVVVGYPPALAAISQPPPILYVMGTILEHDLQSLAVIGTRRPTRYGTNITRNIVNELTNAGITIISGMARGIDGVAHRSALEAGGRTIAVLGTGIDVIFPMENKDLYESIPKSGAVISMFSPGEQGHKGMFVARNRLVSGLSLGVLVTEASEKSGTQITVEYAIEQVKPVFAVPGQVGSSMSEGPLLLIKQGAHMVTSSIDILKVLEVEAVESENRGKNGTLAPEDFEDVLHWQIFELLQRESGSIDELARALKKSAPVINEAVTYLELEGLVEIAGGKVVRL